MDIKKIDEQLSPRPKPLTKVYGTMGICLGEELKSRLQMFCHLKNLKMAQLIKVLVTTYLDEKEGKSEDKKEGKSE